MTKEDKGHSNCNLEYDDKYNITVWCLDHKVVVKLPDIEPDLENGSEFEEAYRENFTTVKKSL